MKLGLLNTSIMTTTGTYSLENVSLTEARALVRRSELDSAIGHLSTAQCMSTVLGVPVALNRQEFAQQIGQQALVFKLNGRAPEGVELNLGDLERIGYSFKVMTRIS